MSVRDHSPIDPSAHSFWSAATPQAKGGSHIEGFKTEEASSVAKRILSQATQTDSDEFVRAFEHALDQRISLMGRPSSLDDMQVAVYETVSDALKQAFEHALYNGEKAKHAGRDLFTVDRAHVKAETVAEDFVKGLFDRKMFGGELKNKELILRLQGILAQKLSISTLDIPKESKPLQERIETTKQRRKEVLTSRDATSIGEADKWGDIQRASSLLHQMLSGQDPLQWRTESMPSQARQMLELADRFSLRRLTQRALSAMNELPVDETLKAQQMMQLAQLTQQGGQEALAALTAYVADNEQAIQTFLRGAQACLEHFPAPGTSAGALPPPPTLAEVEELVKKFNGSKVGSSDHTKLGKELSSMWYLMSLMNLRDKLDEQLAQVQSVFDRYSVIDLSESDSVRPETPRSGDSGGSTPSKDSAAAASAASSADDALSGVYSHSAGKSSRMREAQLAFDALEEWNRRQAAQAAKAAAS